MSVGDENLIERNLMNIPDLSEYGPKNPSGPIRFYPMHGFEIFKDDKEFLLMKHELL